MKKTIMILTIIILLSSLTYGALTDNLVAYYDFNSADGTTITDATDGLNNGTLVGANINTTIKKLGTGSLFCNGTVYASLLDTGNEFDFGAGEFSFNYWRYSTKGTGYDGVAFSRERTETYDILIGFEAFNNYFTENGASWVAGAPFLFAATEAELYGATWTMYSVIRNSQDRILTYTNSTLYANSSFTFTMEANPAAYLCEGQTEFMFGNLDEFGVWKGKALTQTEISLLYNSGTGYNPYSTINFSLSLNNNYTSLPISNFSAIVNGTTYSTITGLITTDIPRGGGALVNITYINDEETFFNKTFLNININSNHIGNVFQSIITPACYEKITNNSLTCVNTLIYPNEGLQNITINVSGYFSTPQEENIIVLDNKTINFTGFYSTNLSINSTFLTGSGNSNCVYNLTGITYPSYNASTSTVVMNTSIGLINGTYSILANCDGYAFQTKNVTIENITQTLIFELFTTNSINISFFDFNTNALMVGTNISIQFLGLTAQTNYTNTSKLYVDLFSPDEYTLLYQDVAQNFRQGKYILQINNRTHNTLNLYLQNSTGTQLILLKVNDRFGDEVPNAQITIQRWDDNGWITDQIVKTDFQGQAEAYYILSDVYYNHVIEKDSINYFSSINNDDDKKIIYAEDVTNGLTFTINLITSDILPSYQSTRDVTTTLTYTNTSNTTGFFRFFWDDPDNSQFTGSLEVYKGGGRTSVCSNSSLTEMGILICSVTHNTTTVYQASGLLDGHMKESMIKRIQLGSGQIDWGVSGYVFAFILVFVAIFVFIATPSMSLFVGTLVFIILAIFGVIFKDMNYMYLTLIIVLTYLVATIKTNGGGT